MEKHMDSVWDRKDHVKAYEDGMRRAVPLTVGPCKGGQNPPNPSTRRPPAPGGSGVVQVDNAVYTVIGTVLSTDGTSEIKVVQPCANRARAVGFAEGYVSQGDNVQQLNDSLFVAELDGNYLEARIFKGTVK